MYSGATSSEGTGGIDLIVGAVRDKKFRKQREWNI